MAHDGKKFEDFLNKYSEPIKMNLNLTDDLLMALKTEGYIVPSSYHGIMENQNVYGRGLAFLQTLMAQPADFGALSKTETLIKVLKNPRHSRPAVAAIFTKWKESDSKKGRFCGTLGKGQPESRGRKLKVLQEKKSKSRPANSTSKKLQQNTAEIQRTPVQHKTFSTAPSRKDLDVPIVNDTFAKSSAQSKNAGTSLTRHNKQQETKCLYPVLHEREDHSKTFKAPHSADSTAPKDSNAENRVYCCVHCENGSKSPDHKNATDCVQSDEKNAIEKVDELQGDRDKTEKLYRKIRKTYVWGKLDTGALEWKVGDNEIKTDQDILKHLNPFGGAEETCLSTETKRGKVLYLNWRFDSEGRDDDYNKLKLEIAVDEEFYAERFFGWLTGDGEPLIYKNLTSKNNVRLAIQKFKDEIVERLETKKLDYILVIVNSYGGNGTQILTDDLTTADLYRDIVEQLDYPRIHKLDKNVPRLYLFNIHQLDTKITNMSDPFEKLDEIERDVWQSPHFVLQASVTKNGEDSNEQAESTCAFFKAIMKEFKGGVNLFTMIKRVQKKIDIYSDRRGQTIKMSIHQSPKFQANQFMFGPRLAFLRPSATSTFGSPDFCCVAAVGLGVVPILIIASYRFVRDCI